MTASLERRLQELERTASGFSVHNVTAEMLRDQMQHMCMAAPAIKVGDTAGDYIGRMEQPEVVTLTRRLWQEVDDARSTR
jgi:uncharacterized SAM-dependent methyltransferase